MLYFLSFVEKAHAKAQWETPKSSIFAIFSNMLLHLQSQHATSSKDLCAGVLKIVSTVR